VTECQNQFYDPDRFCFASFCQNMKGARLVGCMIGRLSEFVPVSGRLRQRRKYIGQSITRRFADCVPSEPTESHIRRLSSARDRTTC